MRDDTTSRETRDPDHIWLRQSVTFSVNGQTRTLEMALPLRPGATPDEVDALLDEADAGMRRLSARLDAHLAEVTGAAPHPTTPRPAASSPAASSPAIPRPAPAERPATPPALAQPSVPAPAAIPVASAGPDLTRSEFLTEVAALGLDARTVMERLKVRSLNGLNLREALDLLRRQALRDGADIIAQPASTPAPEPAPAAQPARSDARFEEEDDSPEFEVSYPDPDDLPSAEEEDFTQVGADEPGDVPDLAELLARPRSHEASVATAEPPAPVAAEEEPTEELSVIRAREVIAMLRAAHAGGQPTEQQRSAYKHIVVEELGEAKARGVVRAVWNITPDRLGPEQYDALIRWGKLDTFADEVESTLTLLRAEWAAAQAAKSAGQGAHPTAAPPATAPAQAPAEAPAESPAESPAEPKASRPAPRGRSSARADANSRSQGGD